MTRVELPICPAGRHRIRQKGTNPMKILTIDDNGNARTIQCSVIEPAVSKPGNILIDKGERDDGITLIPIDEIARITD